MTNTTHSNDIQVNKDLPTLISFSLCPYVQRSVITFNIKQVPFDRIYIDLSLQPAWFTQLVPTGKVPALLYNDDVLFESAIINEFIDESFGDRLQQLTAWERAKERAWISFVDDLIIDQYKMLSAANKHQFEKEKSAVFSKLKTLADKAGKHYFNNQSFGLMDAAIAPVFTRLMLIPTLFSELKMVFGEQSRLISWLNNLTQQQAVKDSVVEDFYAQFQAYFSNINSYLMKQVDRAPMVI